MSNPLGTADFFALEAGECLNRLETLLATPGGPPPDELVRVARALRGAALMAGQSALAGAVGGLETLGKAVRDRRRAWDPVAAERAAQGVDELRNLVRRAREWTDADTARAARLAAALEALAGPGGALLRPARTPAEPVDLNTGVRAFIAREGALIASALDRAARALQHAPDAREPLYAVLRRMQSLRGLAELGDLSPLPEILDGVELAVGDLTRLHAAPPRVHEVIDAAAHALSRVCRDVAERGRPTADTEEARCFTDLLLRAFAAEPDVVPIEVLLDHRAAEPVRRSIAHPHFAAPRPLGPLELVSHGEHLSQSADLLERAPSATERDLRLYGLANTLRALGAATESPIDRALATLAGAARKRIADGGAAARLPAFAALLREAGRHLRRAADGPLSEAALLTIAARFGHLDTVAAGAASTAAPPPDAPASTAPADHAPPSHPPEPIVAIEALAYDGESVFAASAAVDSSAIVPIESLAPEREVASDAPDRMEPAIVGIEMLAPAGAESIVTEAPSILERGFVARELLIADHGLGAPSLAALLDADTPIGAVPDREPAAAAPVVDIAALCYHGRSALARAAEVTAALEAALAREPSLLSVRPLLDELLDLVPLALAVD